MNTNRIEALTDGTFAIVMTLLVLELRVPDLVGAITQGELWSALLELGPRLLSYLLSFVVLGIYWSGHHAQFRFIQWIDRRLIWINILFLMCVALIPFSAAFLGQYGLQQLAIALYGLNLIVVGLLLFGLWTYATTNRRLVQPDLDPELVSVAKSHILRAPILYLLAIGVSFLSTPLSLMIFALVPLIYIVPSRIDGVMQRQILSESSSND